MNGVKEHSLIVIEDNIISTYLLDTKNIWHVGREFPNHSLDIKLHMPTISRNQGRFEKMDDVWFYIDHKSKNGTRVNGKRVALGFAGRVQPIVLYNGDALLFGNGEKNELGEKISWMFFLDRIYDGHWSRREIGEKTRCLFVDENVTISLDKGAIGTVIGKDTGAIIYMDTFCYFVGNIVLSNEE